MVILDEAQDLAPDVLEQIRLLTNLETSTQKLLQVILIGQPELIRLLEREDLRQLSQRVTARYHLVPFSAEDTGAYITPSARHRRAEGADLLRVGGARDPSRVARCAPAHQRDLRSGSSRRLFGGRPPGERTDGSSRRARGARPPARSAVAVGGGDGGGGARRWCHRGARARRRRASRATLRRTARRRRRLARRRPSRSTGCPGPWR